MRRINKQLKNTLGNLLVWCETLKKANYPTTVLILDWETFWDKDYTLKKFSTVEYVCNPRFEVLGLGIAFLDQTQSEFLSPKEAINFIGKVNWNNITVVGQNLRFDCLILKKHFNVLPHYTIDIIDLDRVWDARDRHNLEYMAKKWKSPKPKGDTQQFKGLHWADMNETKRQELAEYTKSDIEIEADIFQKLMPLIPNPEIELPLATQTLHMYLQPNIVVDFKLGDELIEKMQQEMLKAIDGLEWVLDYAN